MPPVAGMKPEQKEAKQGALPMDSVITALRALGPMRILAMFVGMAAMIAITSLMIERTQTPGMVLLYGGLSAQEASRINEFLSTQNVPFETRGDGSVFVSCAFQWLDRAWWEAVRLVMNCLTTKAALAPPILSTTLMPNVRWKVSWRARLAPFRR